MHNERSSQLSSERRAHASRLNCRRGKIAHRRRTGRSRIPFELGQNAGFFGNVIRRFSSEEKQSVRSPGAISAPGGDRWPGFCQRAPIRAIATFEDRRELTSEWTGADSTNGERSRRRDATPRLGITLLRLAWGGRSEGTAAGFNFQVMTLDRQTPRCSQ
jgi:hypothetical protein